MKYIFKRIDEINLNAFRAQKKRQYAALEWLLSGKADPDEVFSYAEAVLADGRGCKGMPEALFWGYDEPGNMPGDARVDFFYITTYLNTAFLMQAYRLIPERLETIPGFGDLLKRAMTACTGRGFAGHGYDNYGFVEGIQIFASVHTKDFIRTHGNLVPEAFVSRYYAAINQIERDVYDEEKYLQRIENSWEENHLSEYKQILEAENEGRHRLFVYGSLMKGQYNHAPFMADAEYLGKAMIRGFGLYDLGYYPGIKHAEDSFWVSGELYDVNDRDYDEICRLEGNGSLYQK